MAIFSFKSKGKKVEEKKEEVVKPIESKPAQFRKYTPRHVAGNTESSPDYDAMSIASQTRKQTSNNIRANASYASSINSRRNDAFTTHANDYFAPGAMRRLQASDPSLGYTKVALARQDQGLGQCASDSGYESAGPSRVPSEHNLDDISRHYLPRPNGGLLPELRLGDDSLSDRSSKSATKKTRFQVDPEPVTLVEQPHERSVNIPAPIAVVEQPTLRNLNPAALEGFKVNKKGNVLDEEGEVIGELVEGDLLDCVRQKVNAKGEVLDDVGKVVGLVRLAVASLPALTVRPPSVSPPRHTADGDSSPTMIVPRSPTIEAAASGQSLQDAARRATRTASERSLSELSKSYARPPMSSVPENNVAEDDQIVSASPELFAYKGEIPEGPPQHTRRRSASPPLLSTHTSGRKPPHVRRISSSGMSARSLGKQPVGNASRKGYLGSYDNSPNGSDDGTDTSNSDDGKLPSIVYRRPASVRSAVTVPAKPRTYFTHGGKVTVDFNAPEPVQAPVSKTKPASENIAPPADVAAKEEKKKGKFGFRFGKK